MSGYDVTIGGTQARIVRGGEDNPTGFREVWRRHKIQGQVNQQAAGVSGSRFDELLMYQTSWAGGSRWEKPLLSVETAQHYFDSNGFDAYTRPGRLRPLNSITAVVDTNFNNDWFMIQDNQGTVAIGTTTITTGGEKDVYAWDPATDVFLRDAGQSSNVVVDNVSSMTYDPILGNVYVLTDGRIDFFDRDANNEGSVLSGLPLNRFQGELMMFDSDLYYYDLNTIDEIDDPEGTPARITRIDDGRGDDFFTARAGGVIDAFITNAWRLAISTSEGIYHVKNLVGTNGLPAAWVYRSEKDSSNTIITTPVATLPAGTVVVSIMWHMGSLILAATSDWRKVLENERGTFGETFWKMQYYHITGDNIGLIGVPDGIGVSTNEYAIANIAGAFGPYLYMLGNKSLFVYDAIRGGLHPQLRLPLSDNSTWRSLTKELNSSDQEILLISGVNTDYLKIIDVEVADAETVVNFGDDTTTYRLESNYFDFGLPLEDKTLRRIDMESDLLSANEQYSIEIEVDDGAFVQRAILTNGQFSSTSVASLGLTGRRFRYAIVFETKVATDVSDFKGLRIAGSTGQMVRTWDINIDGSEFLNIENVPQDPEVIYDAMRVLAATEAPFIFIDKFQEYEQEDSTSHQVTAETVEINKGDAGEAMIRLLLVEEA